MTELIPVRAVESIDPAKPTRLTPAQAGGPIHTRSFTGRFRNLRLLGAGLLFLLFFGTAWIDWNGRQAVLWDLDNRQFHIFGATFWPQDFILLSAILIIAAFGLFFITVLAGRVWCGYACPQSVWTWVFMRVEQITEGDRGQRIKLDAAPWGPVKLLRRSAKHLLWLALSLLTALTFVGYFTPIRPLALELFTVGSLNVFSHQTNINTKSRILCFDIQDLGENLKSVGLLVMLDAIYNRVIQNRREGKYTHVYIDEIYLFFANGSGSGHSITNYSSEFLYKCWKRFRKYGATLTGITQNVKDLLASPEVSNIFENSDFVYMLNQANGDRQILAKQLNISPHQLSYVTHSGEGEGLLFFGNVILPFVDRFPTDLELYRIMTTKLGEVSEGAQK